MGHLAIGSPAIVLPVWFRLCRLRLKLQRVILENKIAAQGFGDSLVEGMGKARQSTDDAAGAQERYNRASQSGAAGIGPSQDGVNFGSRDPGGKANEVNGLKPIDRFGAAIRGTPSGGITRTAGGQLAPPDDSGDYFFNTARKGEGPFGLGVWELKPEAAVRRNEPAGVVDSTRAQFAAQYPMNPNFRPPTPAANYTVNVAVGGKNFPVSVANKSAADQLIDALEESYRAGAANEHTDHPGLPPELDGLTRWNPPCLASCPARIPLWSRLELSRE